MKKNRAFVCAAALGFVAGVAGVAEAGFRRHPAVNCFPYEPDNVSNLWTGFAGQLTNASTSDPMLVVCPLNDESDFRNESIDGVAIDAYNSGYVSPDSTSLAVQVCRQSNSSTSVSCSTVANTGTSGAVTLWATANAVSLLNDSTKTNWYSSIVVRLPRENWTYFSTLYGYGYFNPS